MLLTPRIICRQNQGLRERLILENSGKKEVAQCKQKTLKRSKKTLIKLRVYKKGEKESQSHNSRQEVKS